MSHRLSGLLAGALALLALAAPAQATPVTVRVVGDGVELAATAVETTGAPAGACPGHSAGEALDKAVGQDWDKAALIETILDETHIYNDDATYWNFWINDTYSQQGICGHTVRPGDRILMLVQRDVGFLPTVFPLTLSGVPESVVAGTPFTVTVNEQRTAGAETTPTPVAGATVSDESGTGVVTDAAGHATITLATVGPAKLSAARRGNVESDSVVVNVVGPAATTPITVTPPAGPLASGPDRTAPAAAIVGIAEGRRFARGFGPRRLRAHIAPDPSGLLLVKLRLTRADRGRCTYFSGKLERFRLNHKNRCSAEAGSWFAVEAASDVDYLLPGRLPRGRYVLDVNAVDKAYNRDDARRRGGNRIVFHVG